MNACKVGLWNFSYLGVDIQLGQTSPIQDFCDYVFAKEEAGLFASFSNLLKGHRLGKDNRPGEKEKRKKL